MWIFTTQRLHLLSFLILITVLFGTIFVSILVLKNQKGNSKQKMEFLIFKKELMEHDKALKKMKRDVLKKEKEISHFLHERIFKTGKK